MSYYDQYAQNKTKYLELKNDTIVMVGGNKNTIIHISGPSGSGKTTLGNKLKNKFSDAIVVKDIDDLRVEFIAEHYHDKEWSVIDKEAYQKYIDEYVKNIKNH